MKILSEKNYKISKWDGGITRQLYIEPEDGDYQNRQFRIRISSAVIHKEVSRFTELPGVRRYLMMQKGNVRLEYDFGRVENLIPGQVTQFMGDLGITSYGQGTDLNLMLKDGASGEMFYMEIKVGDTFYFSEPSEKVIFYIIRGQGEIEGTKIQEDNTVILGKEEIRKTLRNTGTESLLLGIVRIA